MESGTGPYLNSSMLFVHGDDDNKIDNLIFCRYSSPSVASEVAQKIMTLVDMVNEKRVEEKLSAESIKKWM